MLRNLFQTFSKYHVYSIVCAIGITVLCTIQIPPQEEIPKFEHIDKVVHFLMYFVFSGAVILESVRLKSSPEKKYIRACIIAFILSGIFGALIEVIQGTLTDYRSADFYDWLFDMGGVVAACLIGELFRRAFR